MLTRRLPSLIVELDGLEWFGSPFVCGFWKISMAFISSFLALLLDNVFIVVLSILYIIFL